MAPILALVIVGIIFYPSPTEGDESLEHLPSDYTDRTADPETSVPRTPKSNSNPGQYPIPDAF